MTRMVETRKTENEQGERVKRGWTIRERDREKSEREKQQRVMLAVFKQTSHFSFPSGTKKSARLRCNARSHFPPSLGPLLATRETLLIFPSQQLRCADPWSLKAKVRGLGENSSSLWAIE